MILIIKKSPLLGKSARIIDRSFQLGFAWMIIIFELTRLLMSQGGRGSHGVISSTFEGSFGLIDSLRAIKLRAHCGFHWELDQEMMLRLLHW